MERNGWMLKALLIASIFITLVGIVFVINKNEKLINTMTSILALLGSIIGLVLSLILKNTVKGIQDKKLKVFISYNISDSDFASRIASDLKRNNIIVFDENEIVKPGDVIGKELENYISHSDKVIVVVSKSSYKSKFLKNEIEIARKSKTGVIPILKEDSEIPNFLSAYKPADFRIDYANSFDQLLASLQV